jgi:hypothetical protein
LRSRLALAWVTGLLAGGCGLIIGLEDRELPAVGPDATADVNTDTARPDTGPGPETDSGPDVGTDGGACPSTVVGCTVGCNADGVCLDEVVSIGVGRSHSCLVRGDGKIFCIGSNGFGQHGNAAGGGTEIWVPVKVMNGATEVRFREIAAGPASNCAITRERDLYCWGDNAFLQLAQPGAGKVTTPTKVNFNGLKVKAVSVGQQATCAIFDVASPAANVACWGHSGSGDLGSGNDPADGGDAGGAFPKAEPQTVPSFRAKSIHVLDTDDDRRGRACAISEGDLPFCWGSTPNDEITGTPPSTTCNPTGTAAFPCAYGPTAWSSSPVKDIVNGVYDVCALVTGSPNKIHCRGTTGRYSADNQCDAPSVGFDITLPGAAGNPQRLVSSHAARCFVNETNDVWCFGWNGAFHSAREGSDNCGLDGGFVPPDHRPSTPLQVTFLPMGGGRDAGAGTPVKAKLLAIGRYSVLSYTTDKKIVGWGMNQEGQLGTRPPASTETPGCFYFGGRCQGPTVIPPPAYP